MTGLICGYRKNDGLEDPGLDFEVMHLLHAAQCHSQVVRWEDMDRHLSLKYQGPTFRK